MSKLLLAALLVSFAATAQSKATNSKPDEVDLVGPTEAQQARAKAQAEAKAKAEAEARASAEKKAREEAEAKARLEAAAKAKAEAEAKAKAEAESKAKAEAEARAKAEAEAKAKAEAEAKAKAEAEARAKAEAKAKAEAEAKAKAESEARAKAEAEARAKAEAEAQEKARHEAEVAAQMKAQAEAAEKARAETEAKAKAEADVRAAKRRVIEEAQARAKTAAEEAKTAVRAAAEAKRRAALEARAAARAAADDAFEAAKEKAKSRAQAAARKKEEARCGKGKKAQPCLAKIAARYDAPAPALEPLALAPVASSDALTLTPLVAAAPEKRVVIVPPAAEEKRAVVVPPTAERAVVVPAAVPVTSALGVKVASATQPLAVSSRPAVIAIPSDELPVRRVRAAEVTNAIQVGPESLILDELRASGEILPGALQLDFGYRFATDDTSAVHHLFLGGLESGRCPEGESCGLHWFVRAGFGPRSDGSHKVAGKTVMTDSLAWSAGIGQAGLGLTGKTVSFLVDGQFEQLAADYLRTTADGKTALQQSATVKQIRLGATVSAVSGAWSGSLRAAGYVYGGDDTSKLKDVPLRGALVDDGTPGLASALQTFAARAEGRWDGASGTSLSLSYGYLAYTGAQWSAAHLGSISLSQRFGRFRIGAGLIVENELDPAGAGFMTVFGTGTLGASF
jgi:hypothetical protein